MGSGVIYAVIVVLWAAVLVPMWLRRHDEVTESRSVDRFQGAMRTLSRRQPGGDRREVLVPRRNATRAVPDGAAEQLTAAAQAAVRRRRTVLALAALTVLLGVLGAFKLVPLWTALLPFVLLLAFLARVSIGARRARARELRARRARAAALRRDRREAAEVAVTTGRYAVDVPPVRAARRDPADPYDQDLLVPRSAPVAPPPLEVPVTVPPRRMDPAFYDAVAERVWEPVPVPVPTYVSAPKAPRSVRVIDLTKPGSWTSGHLSDEELVRQDEEHGEGMAGPAAAPARGDGIVTGEVLVERLRAVGD